MLVDDIETVEDVVEISDAVSDLITVDNPQQLSDNAIVSPPRPRPCPPPCPPSLASRPSCPHPPPPIPPRQPFSLKLFLPLSYSLFLCHEKSESFVFIGNLSHFQRHLIL